MAGAGGVIPPQRRPHLRCGAHQDQLGPLKPPARAGHSVWIPTPPQGRVYFRHCVTGRGDAVLLPQGGNVHFSWLPAVSSLQSLKSCDSYLPYTLPTSPSWGLCGFPMSVEAALLDCQATKEAEGFLKKAHAALDASKAPAHSHLCPSHAQHHI